MLSTLLDRVTRVMERDKPRILHPADFLTQPLLVWVPIAAIGFVWAQDYLGMATFCDPKEGDSVRTCDYVNSLCGGSMSNMTSIRDYNLDTEGVSVEQSRRFLMILLVQAVFLRALFISWWGMSVGEDLLMHMKAWIGFCTDIAEGIEDWYGDIWPDTSNEKVQIEKANVKLYRVQLLVNDAQDHLKNWIDKHATRFYYNYVAYSVFSLSCLVIFGWICGIMSISMFSPQFACEARGSVYSCVDRNAQIIEIVIYFNFLFCFLLAAFEGWSIVSSIQETAPKDLFFCQRIPGMSLKSFTESLNDENSSEEQPFVSRLLSKYFPRHQYLGLALFSKYMYMNRFMIDRLSYLERFCRITEEKNVLALREVYASRAKEVLKKPDIEELTKKED